MSSLQFSLLPQASLVAFSPASLPSRAAFPACRFTETDVSMIVTLLQACGLQLRAGGLL